jgi:uncharacterized protein (TIGR03382 family)
MGGGPFLCAPAALAASTGPHMGCSALPGAAGGLFFPVGVAALALLVNRRRGRR